MESIFKAEFFSEPSSTLTHTISNLAQQLETTGSKEPTRNKSSCHGLSLTGIQLTLISLTGMNLRLLLSVHSQINHQINNTIIQRMALPT